MLELQLYTGLRPFFDEIGSVGKRKYPDGHSTHKLTENDKVLILGLVLERPETYLHEIQRELQALNGTDVDISTIWRCINHNGFTCKKLKTVALQWNEMLQEEYRQEVSVFTKEMFVFVDETGTDHHDALQKFGYSLRQTSNITKASCPGTESVSFWSYVRGGNSRLPHCFWECQC